MSTILLSQEQFSFIALMLKYLASTDDNEVISDTFEIDLSKFKNFIQKRVVIAIETKTKIIQSFSDLLTSLHNVIGTRDTKNNTISLTKHQICSLIRPIIRKAALNPIDNLKLNEFFKKFDCDKDNQNFFIELISP